MAFRQLAYLPDRRSTRTDQSVHIIVRGMSDSRVPYEEKVCTLSISCHGCRYLSRNKVLLGDIATVDVLHLGSESAKYPARVRVRSVKQLANEMLFDIAVELESPQDIWGIASPPEDWVEFSKKEAFSDSVRELQIVPRPEGRRAPQAKWTPTEPARRLRSLEAHSTSPLPPLLAQLAANLREEIGTARIATRGDAIAEDGDESLPELYSQLERKAMTIFESLVRAFVEELTSRSRQVNETRQAASVNTHARWPSGSPQK